MSGHWSLHTTIPLKELTSRDYAIGTDSTNMFRLVDLGVPAPNQVLYHPYAEHYVRGDLARVGDGERMIEWIWDISSTRELATLFRILFDNVVATTYVHNVYVRTDIRTGDYADAYQAFDTWKVTAWRPNLAGSDGSPVVNTPRAYQTVKLTFTKLETP